MDELTLVRGMRSEAQIPDELVGRGRVALAAQIAGELAPKTRRAHTARRWSLGVTAAAALAAAAVVAGSLGWGSHPEQASAAPVLRQAAAAVQNETDPIVGPGQYLKVVGTWFAGETVPQPGGGQIDAMGTYTRTLYVPADRSGVWVRQGSDFTPTRYLESDAKQKWKPEYNASGFTDSGAGGRFSGGNLEPFDPAELPDTGAEALKYLRQKFPGNEGASTDRQVWANVTSELETGLVPAKARAVLYDALARIPDVTVASKQTTIHGATGTAITLKGSGSSHEVQLVIDPATGLLVGERWVQVKASGAFPVGSISESVAITSEVVDHVPTH
ncbi:MAG TPA: CU044_5270 family protein [Gryllotalpicola sp.]